MYRHTVILILRNKISPRIPGGLRNEGLGKPEYKYEHNKLSRVELFIIRVPAQTRSGIKNVERASTTQVFIELVYKW